MMLLSEERKPALAHLAWFVAGLVGAFLLPYVFTSLLSIQRDVYYLLYFAAALSFLAGYVRWSRTDVLQLITNNWRWSLALGVVSAAFVVINVFSRDSTSRPGGLYFAFELVWRGGVYGAVDALLLTAFPAVVALRLLGSRLSGALLKAGYVALAALLILVVTAVYHLGFEQYREDGVSRPEVGNTVISVPMLATLNPAGSIVAHISMHVAAEARSHETDVFLPPQ